METTPSAPPAMLAITSAEATATDAKQTASRACPTPSAPAARRALICSRTDAARLCLQTASALTRLLLGQLWGRACDARMGTFCCKETATLAE